MDTVRSKPHFRVPAFDGSGNNQVCIFVCCILVEVISLSIISTHCSFYTTNVFSPKTTPRLVGPIFHTFVRAKYIYGLIHNPISQTLLDLDNEMLATLFQAVLRLRSKPNSTKIHLLCAIFRIWSLPTMREDFIHQYIRNLKARKDLHQFQANPIINQSICIITSRSQHNAFHRAFFNTLSTKETCRRSFMIWNSARRGPRQPPPITPKGWPIALRLSTRNYVQRLLAVRWYLGTFPIPIPRNPIPLHLRSQLKPLMRLDSTHITKRDIRDLHRTITAIQNDPQ